MRVRLWHTVRVGVQANAAQKSVAATGAMLDATMHAGAAAVRSSDSEPLVSRAYLGFGCRRFPLTFVCGCSTRYHQCAAQPPNRGGMQGEAQADAKHTDGRQGTRQGSVSRRTPWRLRSVPVLVLVLIEEATAWARVCLVCVSVCMCLCVVVGGQNALLCEWKTTLLQHRVLCYYGMPLAEALCSSFLPVRWGTERATRSTLTQTQACAITTTTTTKTATLCGLPTCFRQVDVNTTSGWSNRINSHKHTDPHASSAMHARSASDRSAVTAASSPAPPCSPWHALPLLHRPLAVLNAIASMHLCSKAATWRPAFSATSCCFLVCLARRLESSLGHCGCLSGLL